MKRLLLLLAFIGCAGPHGHGRVGAISRTDVVTTLNAQAGAVATATTTGLSQVTAAGTTTFSQALTAQWGPLPANQRWYCLDVTNGLDSNVGFSDTSAADCGTKAVQTVGQMNAILPINGGGRSVKVLINAGTYPDAMTFGSGRFGYYSFIVRGTVTNATANSTAFLDDTADRTMDGAVTATGMNASGYNPTGAPTTTSVQLLKVGGGSPSFPAETTFSLPGGARIRWASNTTTVALQGIKRTVFMVTGGDTLGFDKPLPAAPVASDVAYLEMPGALFPMVLFSGFTTNQHNPSDYRLSGVQSTGTTVGSRQVVSNGSAQLIFVWNTGTGVLGAAGWSVNLNSVYTDTPSNTNVDTGGVCRATTVSVTGTTQLTEQIGTGVYASNIGFDRLGNAEQYSFVAVAGMSWMHVGTVAAEDTDPDTIGLSAARVATYNPARIIGPGTNGGLFLGASITIGGLDISGQGAKPAIKLAAGGLTVRILGALTGSTGNTDAGLDLALSHGSTIYLQTTPTVTGAAGDVRLCDGTLVTWASLAATPLTDACGNRFISASGNGGASAVTNGAVNTVQTGVGPTGASTSIQRWMKYPDTTGGFFLVPSYHYTWPGTFDLWPTMPDLSPRELN